MIEWIKVLHVFSVLVFCGGLMGLLIVGSVIGRRTADDIAKSEHLRTAIQKWDRFITLPALASVWIFGIWTAVLGSWFSEPWLQIKLIFVVVLSGLHGVLSGRLRRVELNNVAHRQVATVATVYLLLISLAAITVLVVTKPF